MGKRTALLLVLISVVVVGLFTTSQAFIASNIHTCPHSFANDTQDAFGLSNRSAYVQLGLTHRIPCLPYSQREGESPFIAWYKLNESTDIREKENERLVSYNREEIPGNHGPRYSLAYDFGLLIKDVEESDGGKYLCEVIWRDKEYIKQEETINIQVIGHTLPHGSEAVSEASSTASLHRGRRQTLPCECASQTPDVVYWSMGEGVITDTQIIGARFSDGTTLQIQHGADYSIGSDASLTINSLNDVQDTQRYWCHVFKSDGALHSCTTDVQIQDGNPSFLLMASPTELYLPEGFPQVLPCISWTPGDVMCEVRWIHEHDESSQRVVLSYNLSTDTVQADSDYDLASDFGLRIKSVKPTHDGQYTCYIEDGSGNAASPEALDTHVIGDSFPASPYTGNMSSSATVTQGQGMTLLCECAQQSPNASILAVYWSKGEGKNSDTDVIAARLANGSLLNSKNNGFSISSDWSLSMNSLNDSSSFWCHAFRSDDTLSKCHTDVWIMQEAEESKGSNAGSAYWWLLALVIVIVVVLLCLWYRREWSSTSSCKMGEWLESDKKTYKDPELFHITPQGRERLNVEQHSDFFIGSTGGNGCVLQGRSGSGKTNFLKKLRHDLQIIKPTYFPFGPKIVVLTKAQKICDAVRNIKLHISYILHLSDAVILVDDCNSVHVKGVLKAIKGVSRCQLVISTRSAQLAQDMSQEHNWHYVTITGFSDSNARKYVKSKIAVDFPDQYFDYPILLQHVDLHILCESVACLPGFLRRHCEYPDLKRHNSVSEVVTGMLKCMFRTLDATNSLAKCGEGDGLTQEQNEFLAKCGKVALRAMLDRPANEEVPQMDFLQSCTDGNDVLKDGIKMGLILWDENIESKTNDSNEQKSIPQESNREKLNVDVSNSQVLQSSVNLVEEVPCPHQSDIGNSPGEGSGPQVSSNENSTGEVSRQLSNIDNSNKGSSPLSLNIEKFNANVSKSQYPDTYMYKDTCRTSSPHECIDIEEASSQPKYNDIEEASSRQEFDTENPNREAYSSQVFDMGHSNRQASSPKEFEIHEETSTGDAHEETLTGEVSSPLLSDHDSQVRFALEIFRDFCAAKQVTQNPLEWMEKINVNNIDLFENILVFAGTCTEKDDVARAIVKHFNEISQTIRERENSGSLKDEIWLQKLTKLCLEVNFDGRWEGKLNDAINSLFHEGKLQFIGISSHRLRLLLYTLKYNTKNNPLNLKCIELFHIKELHFKEFERYAEDLYPGALGDIETECKTSTDSNQGYKHDKRMFHTLQSLGLQEVISTNVGGECHSSKSAKGLAYYIPEQKHLENIVLWGPILDSQQIRNLVHHLPKLEKLKQLDLRLNTQMDGRALQKIMTMLSECEALTDLRLSLYEVTTEWFDKVEVDMTNDATLLRRLQTLYLLHGRLSQSFGKFLTDTIKHMDNLQCFHVSAFKLVKSDDEHGIPDEVVEEIRRQKPDLIELIVDNKDVLRA